MKISKGRGETEKYGVWRQLVVPLTVIIVLWACMQSRLAFQIALIVTPEPETCALCDGWPRHAPCLVDLSTGEVGELTVYDRDPFHAGKLAEEQPVGAFSIMNCVGVTAVRDTWTRSCAAEVPKVAGQMAPVYFCKDCRTLLTDVDAERYALLDLYDLEGICVYPIDAGKTYTIREYEVSIQKSETIRDDYTVTVQGKLSQN